VHLLAGAVVAAQAFAWSVPGWEGPLLVFAGVLVFAFGILLYLWHWKHWSAATLAGFVPTFYSALWPEIKGDLAALDDALPPSLKARLEALETELGPLKGAPEVVSLLRQLAVLVPKAAEAAVSPQEANTSAPLSPIAATAKPAAAGSLAVGGAP
jgi:hypothetical protein